MRQGPWHIFHFIGHGGFDPDSGGLIVLADEAGRRQDLPALSLARLLDGHRWLKIVLLNSCEGARGSESDVFSSTAAKLVRRGIPAVLAMQYEITDQAAIEFARSFYEGVADGLAVDAAVAHARESISVAMPQTVEWGTPVLYMRSPDGMLFNIARRQEPSVPVKPPIVEVTSPGALSSPRPHLDVEPPPPNEQYDIFISYSHADGEWVRNGLLPKLEGAGLKVCIDDRDFEIGVPSLVNMERAVEQSLYTLAVLTPNWVASEWTEFESLLVGTSDPAGRRRKLLPVMLAPCQLPARIRMLTYADLRDPTTRDAQLDRLVQTLRASSA